MGWSAVLLFFTLGSVWPPPHSSTEALSAVYHPETGPQLVEGRRFGGYRIVPKTCKDTSNRGVKGKGICMFNYECTRKNGTVVGSCMDGFLFGACCRLPPGTNYISIDMPQTTVTQRTSTTLSALGSSSSVTYNSADTVLFHENGTVANEPYRPEDFEFNSRPELFVATDSTPPPQRHSTNSQKSTAWKTTTENWLTTRVRPTWIDHSEGNLVQIPTINAAGSSQGSDSINHILSMLDDNHQSSESNQVAPERYTPAESSTTPTLSTWVSIESQPTSQYRPTTPSYYSSKNPQSTVIYSTTPSGQFSSYYNNKPQSTYKPQTTHKPYYTNKPSSYTTYYTSPKPTKPSVTYTDKPISSYYTHSTEKPTTSYYTKKPTTYTTYTKPSYGTPTKWPSTTTQYVQGPGFQVSLNPKPPTTPEPAPTVILLGPTSPSKRPTIHSGTIITVNPDGDIVTYKPPPAATAKPIYHGVNHGALFTTIKPEVSTLGTTGSVHHRPIYTTPTQVIKDNIANTTELFAFPPVRDPYANLSQTQQPEVVSWITPSTIVLEDDETTPALIEDENLDNKVHKFVEKIVQSLQGNFVDLENVLVDGESTPNVTVSTYAPPIKRPSTTTKRPTRKPTKKPTTSYYTTTYKPTRPRPTLALITRPPPRPSTTKKPYTTKRPSSTPSTTFFSEETSSYLPSTTESIGTYSTTHTYDEPIDYKRECGVRPLMKNGRIVGGKGATFGEWPWQVLVREATWLGLFTKNKCGGVLITNKYVITAAHCQPGFLASLIAVFGEYDISGELESKRSSSRNVRRVIVHRHYDAATFENDIALLELETPVQFDQHIVPICMPEDSEDFTGKMATVTGWGRLKYGGGVPSVLQEVQVPVMENNVCQEMFHTAGHSKTILQSFICAGYANGQRDSCEGDSGGPLMIERPNGHWVLAGTVSHGIKCAAPYLPGVYMRTTYYKPWLQTITGVRKF